MDTDSIVQIFFVVCIFFSIPSFVANRRPCFFFLEGGGVVSRRPAVFLEQVLLPCWFGLPKPIASIASSVDASTVV